MRKEYFVKLDVIRIISCILILFYHLNIIKGGFLPVCTFFVLSGYLSAKGAIQSKDFKVKEFYLKRLKSIYLPLVVVVSLTVLLYKIFSPAAWLSLKPETQSVVFGYNNFWQLSANFDYFTRNTNSPFFHLWFIAILLQFDLVFPIFAVIFKKANKRINKNFSFYAVLILTVIATLLFFIMSKTQDIMVAYYNSFSRCFSLLFGVLFAQIQSKSNNASTKILTKHCNLIFAIYSLVLILLCVFVSASSKHFAFFMILTTIISVRLIKYATLKPKIKRRNEQIIKLISKGLYEVYLVQYPVIFFLQGLKIVNPFKALVIIVLTVIFAYAIHFALNAKIKSKSKKALRVAIIAVLIVSAFFAVVNEKDRSAEMDELKERLSENEKLAEEKKNEFFGDSDTETSKSSSTTTTTAKSTTTTVNRQQIEETVHSLRLVGVGDSLMLDAIDEFYEQFPNAYFDGQISRSMYGGEDVLIALKNEDKLPDTLVLCLSQNTDFSTYLCEQLMEIVENRQVYWVNAVGADDPEFNDRFEEFAKNYPNIHIVDWAGASESHPEYFYPDEIHTNPTGIRAYVNTVFETICEVYSQSRH